MTTEKLSKKEKEYVRELANSLVSYRGFYWGNTKEGHRYWCDVYRALMRIAGSNKKKCPHCGEVIEDE